jgi:hypothetical protein
MILFIQSEGGTWQRLHGRHSILKRKLKNARRQLIDPKLGGKRIYGVYFPNEMKYYWDKDKKRYKKYNYREMLKGYYGKAMTQRKTARWIFGDHRITAPYMNTQPQEKLYSQREVRNDTRRN